MAGIRLQQGEEVRVDVTTPLTSLVLPVCELLLITGLCWMGIGFLDSLAVDDNSDPTMRNGVVFLWAALICWRFVLPVVRARKERVIVTDRRLILRAPGLMGAKESIPFHAVRHVSRKRKNIFLAVAGYSRPIHLPNVAKAKYVVNEIEQHIGWH
ncbi:hypothetical protein [Corynebacterium belfantii]|uniref:Bacterial membrane flanked domain protein n=1 Tax=Corynebacterium belfantii TaxID=2014537 RepID=A0ABS0L9I2_9CORY|nr:hypothetical protein [Corynebacterium belfantii]OLN16412.1 hypothetical protein BUE64_02980 [Corynebacterium diphtheriae subsp. lausannense]QVI97570.1 hypothetical protein KFR76_08060 [Corynebacterium diphtheriae]MBG9243642.1 hypothetical protein [Corynebacterium belfantii]MBG9258368.1 hypothetical protein [Corynebacterium belfantii]MBG9265087.1 hypothetical protein [Corynebacterium belfantii]